MKQDTIKAAITNAINNLNTVATQAEKNKDAVRDFETKEGIKYVRAFLEEAQKNFNTGNLERAHIEIKEAKGEWDNIKKNFPGIKYEYAPRFKETIKHFREKSKI